MIVLIRIFLGVCLLGAVSLSANAAPHALGFCNLTGEVLTVDFGYGYETVLWPETNQCIHPVEADVHTTFKIKHAGGYARCAARPFAEGDQPKCVQLEGDLKVEGGNGMVLISIDPDRPAMGSDASTS